MAAVAAASASADVTGWDDDLAELTFRPAPFRRWCRIRTSTTSAIRATSGSTPWSVRQPSEASRLRRQRWSYVDWTGSPN